MARYSNSLTEVFESYGDDASGALEAWGNVDPEAWSAYCDSAVEKQYLSDYHAFARSLTRSVDKETITANAGQPRLFDPPEASAEFRMRERIRFDGHEYELASLAGTSGAQIIRDAALRDRKVAITTLERCNAQVHLADHIESESERLDRDVTAGEVLGWQVAA